MSLKGPVQKSVSLRARLPCLATRCIGYGIILTALFLKRHDVYLKKYSISLNIKLRHARSTNAMTLC